MQTRSKPFCGSAVMQSYSPVILQSCRNPFQGNILLYSSFGVLPKASPRELFGVILRQNNIEQSRSRSFRRTPNIEFRRRSPNSLQPNNLTA
jgi:hypothetical protein